MGLWLQIENWLRAHRMRPSQEGSIEILAMTPALAFSQLRLRKLIVVDVRRAVRGDSKAMFIDPAYHIPFCSEANSEQRFGEELSRLVKRRAQVLFVCQDGEDSEKAAAIARSMGYRAPRFLHGGIRRWVKESRPTVSHAYLAK